MNVIRGVGGATDKGGALEAELKKLPPSEAIKVLQGTINSLTGRRIKVDGKIGPETLKAYYAVPDSRKGLFMSLVTAAKVDLPPVVSMQDIEAAIAARAFSNVPASYLQLLAEVEPARIGDIILLDRSGKYVGITQFDSRSYDAVRTADLLTPSGVSVASLLPPFAEFVKATPAVMVKASIEAAAAYYLLNERYLRRNGISARYTDEVAYLAHNQGAEGARTYLTTGSLKYPDQSRDAISIFGRIPRDRYVA